MSIALSVGSGRDARRWRSSHVMANGNNLWYTVCAGGQHGQHRQELQGLFWHTRRDRFRRFTRWAPDQRVATRRSGVVLCRRSGGPVERDRAAEGALQDHWSPRAPRRPVALEAIPRFGTLDGPVNAGSPGRLQVRFGAHFCRNTMPMPSVRRGRAIQRRTINPGAWRPDAVAAENEFRHGQL
jgi:hypothetical protein